jgi:hypothetical protein
MKTLPMQESGRATADSSGVATVRLGPRRAFETWAIESVAIESTSTLIPELREYLGDAVPSRLTGSSRAGDLDSGVNPNPIQLLSGQDIVYQWTGCTVGAICQVTITGTKNVP